MKLGPIVLKLRLADTRFENRIGGAAELEIAQKGTLKADMAFVIQLSEIAGPNILDSGISQVITETCAIVVALANDTTQKDKTGLIAHDALYDVRTDLFKALLGWTMPGSESLMEYVSGRLLDINRGYLWYQFEFNVDTRITEQDGVDVGEDELPSFDTIYAQFILAPDTDNLPVPGIEGDKLPAIGGVDMAQFIDFTS